MLNGSHMSRVRGSQVLLNRRAGPAQAKQWYSHGMAWRAVCGAAPKPFGCPDFGAQALRFARSGRRVQLLPKLVLTHLATWLGSQWLAAWAGRASRGVARAKQVIYAPRVRADPTATLACDAQHTPLDRRCSERTASGILPH